MYLLDTNVVSESFRSRPDPRVVEWLASIPAHELRLSVVTDMEIERGVLLRERKDPRQGATLRRWAETARAAVEHQILDVTVPVARICAEIQIPDRRPMADALIAATALHHDLIVVTRNEKDFDVPGLRVLNPFSA